MKNNTAAIVLGIAIFAGVGIIVVNMMGSPSESMADSQQEVTSMQPTKTVMQGETSATETTTAPGTIVETAVNAGQFNTLVTAVKAAGLVETLSGEGPFTVFAPTDEAFAKLPAGTLESVLADKDLLTSILTYHVVSGKVMAADAVKLTSAPTVQGQNLKIEVTDEGVMINNAKVITTDIETSNGVIHVIDTVLLPE